MPNGKDGRPTLATFSGLEFSPLDPKPEEIRLLDIAHGLAFTCRYAAQIPRFYSVAEHSSLVCQLLEQRYPKERTLHQWGLMHDASEAYLGDMPRPLKDLDLGYQKTEARLMKVIAELFGLNPVLQPEEVHSADSDVFLREREELWGSNVDWWLTQKAPEDTASLKMKSLLPEQAEALFLSTFKRVFGEFLNE